LIVTEEKGNGQLKKTAEGEEYVVWGWERKERKKNASGFFLLLFFICCCLSVGDVFFGWFFLLFSK